MRAAVVLLLMALPVFGQVTSVERDPGPIVLRFPVSEGSQIFWEPIQPLDLEFERIETKGKKTLIIDAQGELTTLPEGEFHALASFKGKPGQTVVMRGMEVNWETRVFNFRRYVVKFKGKPDNPPNPPRPGPDDPDDDDDDEPSPDVPDDEFDNIGKRVAKWAEGLPRTKQAGECYRDSARLLREDPVVTVNSISAKLTGDLRSKIDIGVYQTVFKNVNADLMQRWGSGWTKGMLAAYYDAVANGLEGADGA